MPTLAVSPNPFVKWVFKCETPADERRKKKIAREYLKAYLKGYVEALKMAGVGTFQYVFKDNLSPKRRGSKDFKYTAVVERKARNIVAGPDSTKNPPQPTQPNP